MVARGDVLILDTRFSAGAEFPSLQPSSRTSGAEYLSASPGFERIAVACPDNCFTNRLTETLQNIQESAFTVAQIHAFLVQQANDPKNALESTPVHVARPLKPSITIRYLKGTPREVTNMQSGLGLSAGKVFCCGTLTGRHFGSGDQAMD